MMILSLLAALQAMPLDLAPAQDAAEPRVYQSIDAHLDDKLLALSTATEDERASTLADEVRSLLGSRVTCSSIDFEVEQAARAASRGRVGRA